MMFRYFQKSLQPFILTELQNKNHKLKNFFQVINKVILTKAKANLHSWGTTKNID